MKKKKYPMNESGIPEYAVERFARCVLEDIREDFARAEVQAEFARWMEERKQGSAQPVTGSN